MTITSALTTFSQVAGAGADWDTPGNCAVLDGTVATLAPPPLAGADVTSDYLKGLDLVESLPKGDIQAVRVKVRAWQDDAVTDCHFEVVELCDATGPLSLINGAEDEALTETPTTFTFTFTAAELATLALTTADVQAATFGVALKIHRDDDPAAGGGLPYIDAVWVEIDIDVARMGGMPSGDRYLMVGNGYRMTRRGH